MINVTEEWQMELIERINIAKPMQSKWIRADRLWNRIAGSAFFSTEEKEKIRLVIETEPGEETK